MLLSWTPQGKKQRRSTKDTHSPFQTFLHTFAFHVVLTHEKIPGIDVLYLLLWLNSCSMTKYLLRITLFYKDWQIYSPQLPLKSKKYEILFANIARWQPVMLYPSNCSGSALNASPASDPLTPIHTPVSVPRRTVGSIPKRGKGELKLQVGTEECGTETWGTFGNPSPNLKEII